MTILTLVYPYFHPHSDTSIFRFPPLGLGYIAANLKQKGISVEIIDCTFMTQKEALKKIIASKPKIIGIQSMYSMKEKSFELAKLLKTNCELLVAVGYFMASKDVYQCLSCKEVFKIIKLQDFFAPHGITKTSNGQLYEWKLLKCPGCSKREKCYRASE